MILESALDSGDGMKMCCMLVYILNYYVSTFIHFLDNG